MEKHCFVAELSGINPPIWKWYLIPLSLRNRWCELLDHADYDGGISLHNEFDKYVSDNPQSYVFSDPHIISSADYL